MGWEGSGDYWPAQDLDDHIMFKEAKALMMVLTSARHSMENARVDVFVDNKALCDGWKKQGTRSEELNRVLMRIAQLSLSANCSLVMQFVPSAQNPADAPSRSISKMDAMLSPLAWARVQQLFGGVHGHSFDLMLDSNAMRDAQGNVLPHFTPFPSPLSAGCNLFSQTLSSGENYYVFPPIGMVASVIAFLMEQRMRFTLVCPSFEHTPHWWPSLLPHITKQAVVGERGEKGMLYYPSKKGFKPDTKGLPWNLSAFRCAQNQAEEPSHANLMPFHCRGDGPRLLFIGDSIIRFLSMSHICSRTCGSSRAEAPPCSPSFQRLWVCLQGVNNSSHATYVYTLARTT